MTSGSGSGLPFLVQRTLAKQVNNKHVMNDRKNQLGLCKGKDTIKRFFYSYTTPLEIHCFIPFKCDVAINLNMIKFNNENWI